eukprot:1193863-Prorocentrum_minimum.AAC.1
MRSTVATALRECLIVGYLTCWARGRQTDSLSTRAGTSYPSCTWSDTGHKSLRAGEGSAYCICMCDAPPEVSRTNNRLPLVQFTNSFTKGCAYISASFSGGASPK